MSSKTIITIGKKRLEQLEGMTVDDIYFKDMDTNEEYSFDQYLELIKGIEK